MTKTALTGRLRVGKSYTAEHSGGTEVNFAAPLYALGVYFTGLGEDHKDKVPSLRKTYVKISSWGRGEISEQYPVTVERALFTAWVKSGAAAKVFPGVNWSLWGQKDIWVDAVMRAADKDPANRIFASNCRFKDQYDKLVGAGWDHWHVMCSRETYEERLQQVGMTLRDPQISDPSEQLADAFDKATVAAIKGDQTGPKLKVIWNDSRPSPSPRLQSLEEFQTYLQNEQVKPDYTYSEAPAAPVAPIKRVRAKRKSLTARRRARQAKALADNNNKTRPSESQHNNEDQQQPQRQHNPTDGLTTTASGETRRDSAPVTGNSGGDGGQSATVVGAVGENPVDPTVGHGETQSEGGG